MKDDDLFDPDKVLGGTSEDDDSSDELPAITKLAIDVTDERGKRFVGEFTYTVPTLGDQLLIGRKKALLFPAGILPGDSSGMISEMTAYLEVTLAKEGRPSWYKPTRFYGAAVLSEIYAHARAYEARFLGVGGDDDAVDAKETAEGSDAAGEGDVERDVQPPAERRETLVSHDHRSDAAASRKERPRRDAKRAR